MRRGEERDGNGLNPPTRRMKIGSLLILVSRAKIWEDIRFTCMTLVWKKGI